jgi:biopolymer transport protein ExbD
VTNSGAVPDGDQKPAKVEKEEAKIKDVKVPEADKAATPRKGGEIVITVNRDGTLTMGGKAVDEEKLTAQLKEIARLDAKRAIIIRGDKDTGYEKIVRILDITHKAGLYHVSFATRVPDKK